MEVESQTLSTFDLKSKPPFYYRVNLPLNSSDLHYHECHNSDLPDFSHTHEKPQENGIKECQNTESFVKSEVADESPELETGLTSSSEFNAAVKMQKLYWGYRTRRRLADSAIVAEELWWQAIDFERLNHSTVSFFNFLKPETATSRWNRISLNASKISEKKTELARFEALDCGKPLDEAAWDIDDVASCFEYYADLAEALDSKQKAPISLPMETFKCHVLKEPIGVVGLITPWNYPLLMATWKVAPALAAGCAAILKPSELASVTCLELAAVCKEVGLPPGVLNVLTGYGPEAGAPLASHPHVDKIAFTGSTATGNKIMSAAAQMVKPVSLELGGKSPIVVFEDVDLDKAAEWTLFGCFWTNGQICSATSRLLVHESIAAEFLDRLAKWSKNIKISDPMEEGCRLGPVVSARQYEKILECISTAKREGATILCGGVRPQHLKKGYFLEPTIITDVTTSMQIWREEVFGPVLCVKTFSTEEEAIELANDTHYGLGAAVISNDLERCDRITKALNAGIVWVNCSQPCFCQAPWGGNKRSGFGRELGEWGLDNYLSVKQVTRYISDEPWGWYPSPSKL